MKNTKQKINLVPVTQENIHTDPRNLYRVMINGKLLHEIVEDQLQNEVKGLKAKNKQLLNEVKFSKASFRALVEYVKEQGIELPDTLPIDMKYHKEYENYDGWEFPKWQQPKY